MNINNISLHDKGPNEAKHQVLINKLKNGHKTSE